MLMAIRPYIRYIDTQRSTSTTSPTARSAWRSATPATSCRRAIAPRRTRPGSEDRVLHPEGRRDHLVRQLAIPKDAPHPKNAHAFINYMLGPEVIAAVNPTP